MRSAVTVTQLLVREDRNRKEVINTPMSRPPLIDSLYVLLHGYMDDELQRTFFCERRVSSVKTSVFIA